MSVSASSVCLGDGASGCGFGCPEGMALWSVRTVCHLCHVSPFLLCQKSIARRVGFYFQLVLWAKHSGTSGVRSSMAVTLGLLGPDRLGKQLCDAGKVAWDRSGGSAFRPRFPSFQCMFRCQDDLTSQTSLVSISVSGTS